MTDVHAAVPACISGLSVHERDPAGRNLLWLSHTFRHADGAHVIHPRPCSVSRLSPTCGYGRRRTPCGSSSDRAEQPPGPPKAVTPLRALVRAWWAGCCPNCSAACGLLGELRVSAAPLLGRLLPQEKALILGGQPPCQGHGASSHRAVQQPQGDPAPTGREGPNWALLSSRSRSWWRTGEAAGAGAAPTQRESLDCRVFSAQNLEPHPPSVPCTESS